MISPASSEYRRFPSARSHSMATESCAPRPPSLTDHCYMITLMQLQQLEGRYSTLMTLLASGCTRSHHYQVSNRRYESCDKRSS